MHPRPAQGANSAFADVVALAAALKEADVGIPAAAIDSFEKARVTPANEVQAMSRLAGLGQAAGKLGRAPHNLGRWSVAGEAHGAPPPAAVVAHAGRGRELDAWPWTLEVGEGATPTITRRQRRYTALSNSVYI